MWFLKNVAGAKYNWEQQPEKSIDPEELRYNQNHRSMEQEGARVITKDFSVLQHPAIQTAMELVNNLICLRTSTCKRRKGPRNNGVLEGTFNKNYTTLYTNIEEPLVKTTASLTKAA
jgi:hypothetical protein